MPRQEPGSRFSPIAALQADASAGTLYASSSTANTVTEYSLRSGTLIGTLGASSGINGNPEGMFFTKSHLYVTNGNQVLVFPVGQMTPSLTLQEPPSVEPFEADVAVGRNGTVYVANYIVNYSGPGIVVVFGIVSQGVVYERAASVA